MTKRTRKHILTATLAGAVIVAAVCIALYFKGFGCSAAEPNQRPSGYAEDRTKSRLPGEKEAPAERPKSVLKSALAGSWYPADPEALKKMLKEFFDSAQLGPRNDVIAVILPHAGYSYSGKTACAALKTITRHYDRIKIGRAHV